MLKHNMCFRWRQGEYGTLSQRRPKPLPKDKTKTNHASMDVEIVKQHALHPYTILCDSRDTNIQQILTLS